MACAGRGVGLDVVNTFFVGQWRLRVYLEKGSKFIIRLPLTLAIIQALMVGVGDEKYAIPLSNIKIITAINRADITKVRKSKECGAL